MLVVTMVEYKRNSYHRELLQAIGDSHCVDGPQDICYAEFARVLSNKP
jgi:hypothetical protein